MFKRHKTQPSLPTEPVSYPASTFIETEKGYFYINNDKTRFRLLSKRVLDSWAPHRIIKTSEAAVARYRISARMKFRNGSLIWDTSDAKVYLVENGKRRPVVSPDVYERLGIDSSDFIEVSKEEALLHELGEELA